MAYLTAIQQILEDQSLKDRFVANGLAYTQNLSWPQLANRYFEQLITLTQQKAEIFKLAVA